MNTLYENYITVCNFNIQVNKYTSTRCFAPVALCKEHFQTHFCGYLE